MESVHGHDVMHMMLENPNGWTKEALLEKIKERFGENAVFHTCSAQGMDSQQLLEFLEGRQKFIPTEDGFNTDKDRICNH